MSPIKQDLVTQGYGNQAAQQAYYASLPQDRSIVVNQDYNQKANFTTFIERAVSLFGTISTMANQSGGMLKNSSISDYLHGKSIPKDEKRMEWIFECVKRQSDALIFQLQSGVEHEGIEINLLRRLKGISQEKFAEALQLRSKDLALYEQRGQMPSVLYEQAISFLRNRSLAAPQVYPQTSTYLTLDAYIQTENPRQKVAAFKALMYGLIQATDSFKGRGQEESRRLLQEAIPRADVGYLLAGVHALLDGSDPYLKWVLNINSLQLMGENDSKLEIILKEGGGENDRS